MTADPDTPSGTAGPDDAASPRTDDGRWADRGVVPSGAGGTGWVVVADEAIARILTTTAVPRELVPLHALTDPAAHAKEGSLHVNDAGRRGGRVGGEGRGGHAGSGGGGESGSTSVTTSAGDSNRHLVARAFAKRLAGHLADALRQKQFETLRIVAAPRFLGLLRQELDAKVEAAVVEQVSKDLTHASDADVARRLLGDPAPG